jgi:predicted DNA-binding transcriptional regulator AlpA
MTKRPAKTIPPQKRAKQFAAALPPQPPLITQPPKPDRLLDRNELQRMIPFTYPTIWKWMREGNFPRAKNTGGKITWLESEVEEWIKSRPLQPIKDDQGAAS